MEATAPIDVPVSHSQLCMGCAVLTGHADTYDGSNCRDDTKLTAGDGWRKFTGSSVRNGNSGQDQCDQLLAATQAMRTMPS